MLRSQISIFRNLAKFFPLTSFLKVENSKKAENSSILFNFLLEISLHWSNFETNFVRKSGFSEIKRLVPWPLKIKNTKSRKMVHSIQISSPDVKFLYTEVFRSRVTLKNPNYSKFIVKSPLKFENFEIAESFLWYSSLVY